MNIDSFSVKEFDFVNYKDCSEAILMEILKHRNSSEISRWMRNTSAITREQHFSFVESLKASDEKKYFAVFKDREYVGSIYIIMNEDGLWERGLYVIPEVKGKGIASSMEKYFLERLKESGVKDIVAEVYADNNASLRFHEKMGYRVIKDSGEKLLFRLVLN